MIVLGGTKFFNRDSCCVTVNMEALRLWHCENCFLHSLHFTRNNNNCIEFEIFWVLGLVSLFDATLFKNVSCQALHSSCKGQSHDYLKVKYQFFKLVFFLGVGVAADWSLECWWHIYAEVHSLCKLSGWWSEPHTSEHSLSMSLRWWKVSCYVH